MVDGAKRVHGTMEKGDFFGEMSILEGMPRTIAAEAVEDSELIEINSMTFDKMIKGNIEIAIRMLRKLSIRPAGRRAADRGAPAGGRRGRAAPSRRDPGAPTGLGGVGRAAGGGG
jgi:hypothetical protein